MLGVKTAFSFVLWLHFVRALASASPILFNSILPEDYNLLSTTISL
jgi:hypothetical protein